ncbi:MAG: hypothetical protein HYX47_10370 [Burkholderiales bacterium]|nr:hypothetical protein [Burkholderiales bacterium]
MSYHDHAQLFRPEPQRPICYRTKRTLAQRARPVLLIALVAGGVVSLVLATAFVIARMEATQAQLDTAHAQGMATGATTCRSN